MEDMASFDVIVSKSDDFIMSFYFAIIEVPRGLFQNPRVSLKIITNGVCGER